jgi:quercetin dioxygenase-like cupin family protein
MLALSPISALAQEMAAIFATEGREDANLTGVELTTGLWPEGLFHVPMALEAAMRACLATSGHPCAAAIEAAIPMTPWGTNPVADRMLDKEAAMIAVATLLDPDGPMISHRFRAGLLFQRPGTYYRLHNHDAVETYAIVAGSADWIAGDDRRIRRAGDVIHHPSRMPHAFRAGPEGFVAIWRWSGDINSHSYTFLPDPEAD